MRWSRRSASSSRCRCASSASLRLPGGAVDALQLLVLLVAAPVRRGRAHQLERRDPLGGRQVRPAAEVLPRQRAVAPEVVVDGELGAADLGRRRPRLRRSALGALEADQLELVRLGRELGSRASSSVTGRRREPLALLDDLAHPRLDLLEVLGVERLLDVEVVVEAVGDRRADAELGVGNRAPARPAPSRARSSAAGCRGRRRSRWRPARRRRRRPARAARSRSSPSTRAAITSASSANSSQAFVPVVTVRSARSSALATVTLRSDTCAPSVMAGRDWRPASSLDGIQPPLPASSRFRGCRRHQSGDCGPTGVLQRVVGVVANDGWPLQGDVRRYE